MPRVALVVLALSGLAALSAGSAPVSPYESGVAAATPTRLDLLMQAGLERHGLFPAYPCSDEVFLRRVYLDMLGTLPEAPEVRRFLSDRSPGKRATLVEALFLRPEFADYWAMKWCDALRVKAEFPINLWPNAVQAYHRWIRQAVRDNLPYDQFARQLLTSSGSNFRVPPVNFYRATAGREPAALAGAAALTFMGTRLEGWPEARRAELAVFFSRVAYKPTAEWKEEIVLSDPAPAAPLSAVLPDGKRVRIAPGDDPRRVFADWLISPDNPWFARCAVNRLWAWLLGRGLIHEPDDIRPDNPPVHPEVLAYLERELVDSGYDLRHVMRLILNSSTYQQSPIPRGGGEQAEALFACYPVRRMDAEVLADALAWLGGGGTEYESPIPEPFTFIPASRRSIALADGSIGSAFLEQFGRPARDTGLWAERNLEPSDGQRLFLLNSSDVQRRIERSGRLRQLLERSRGNRSEAVRVLYLSLLSRFPTEEEESAARAYLETSGLGPRQAAEDLAWALINSKEFLYRH